MGLTVLDAGVLIAVLDSSDEHHAAATQAVVQARDQADALIVPVSAYAEMLVAPSRRGQGAAATVDQFLDALPARIEPATRSIGARAAALRAEHGPSLRLPDALVIATALELGADRIVTTDTRWPTMLIPVEVIAGA